jgi:hypothetical protein
MTQFTTGRGGRGFTACSSFVLSSFQNQFWHIQIYEMTIFLQLCLKYACYYYFHNYLLDFL